mmetsp:Transcript_52145/g.169362  ORF Transcript_52145/g.169362 Transcript_52145/m.169362 type:complete len:216 (+) Transcript_52145:103-750(+)
MEKKMLFMDHAIAQKRPKRAAFITNVPLRSCTRSSTTAARAEPAKPPVLAEVCRPFRTSVFPLCLSRTMRPERFLCRNLRPSESESEPSPAARTAPPPALAAPREEATAASSGSPFVGVVNWFKKLVKLSGGSEATSSTTAPLAAAAASGDDTDSGDDGNRGAIPSPGAVPGSGESGGPGALVAAVGAAASPGGAVEAAEGVKPSWKGNCCQAPP